MRPTGALLAGLAPALLLLAACANPQATLTNIAYGDPAKPYLGMSKDEVLACAGEPHSTYRSGANGETLTYHYSGAGPVPAAGGGKKKDKPGPFGIDMDKKRGDWTCSASLTFENGRLTRVSFSHKDVRSPYEWQAEKDPNKAEKMRDEGVPSCTFSLPNCRR